MASDQDATRAFEALHQGIQRWIARQEWPSLRPTQTEAIPKLLPANRDVVIAAATAGGKTEAAFLPALSRLLHDADDESSGLIVYISPLKALINDQFRRLELMIDGLDVPATPWHGDIPQRTKHQFLREPRGVLLITPESLEAILVNHGQRAPQLFAGLRYIIVDELHAFIGLERGMQLQSLMHRLELAIKKRVARVGLSATLGDMGLAANFLRPGNANRCDLIISTEDAGELQLQVRGYRQQPPALSDKQAEIQRDQGAEIDLEDVMDGDVLEITEHLFRAHRGTNNLVFANARRDVETYSDLLRRKCDDMGVPCEFFPHHGSLSNELRQHVETGLQRQSQPVTAVCTSTLEMGIDIGSVSNIAQIGAPHRVASMRQRLGRSGRRGEPAKLRIYVRENSIDAQTTPHDRLRPELFQAVAMTELLLARWSEPPQTGALHLSTLIQQVLSVIAQHGGATAQGLWNALCVNAPFEHVGRDNFKLLLKQMGETSLLMQSPDGLLLHGEVGEQIVNHYSFYTAFNAPEEFTLAVDAKIIGTLPIDKPIAEGSYLIFGGRRWLVKRIDNENKRIDLSKASGGKAPNFGGTPGNIHDVVRAEMYDLYNGTEAPAYLNAQARELLEEGRYHFRHLQLDRTPFVTDGANTLVFPWVGDVTMDSIAALLSHEGIQTEREGQSLRASNAQVDEVQAALQRLLTEPVPPPHVLASRVKNKESEKYDRYLGDDLLARAWASKRLNINGALQAVQQLVITNH